MGDVCREVWQYQWPPTWQYFSVSALDVDLSQGVVLDIINI